MKITFDTKTNQVKVGGKLYNDAVDYKKQEAESYIRNFLINNTKLSDYEETCMWMSYRYSIGRHTIASHMQAYDIWKHCKGRMSKERELFTAYDINREIEQQLSFINPNFYFPITSLNRIYTSAIDIFCEFMEDYNIQSKEDLLKYKDVHVILTDNERGYKLETVTWEEYLRPKVLKYCQEYYAGQKFTEDDAWDNFLKRKEGKITNVKFYEDITKDIPNPDYFYMHDIEDLFVWNDLVHCFDYEHHHKSILTDGSECEWFWTWTSKSEQRDDGYYYKSFGYKRIRVPLNSWNGVTTTWIPDENIKENIY